MLNRIAFHCILLVGCALYALSYVCLGSLWFYYCNSQDSWDNAICVYSTKVVFSIIAYGLGYLAVSSYLDIWEITLKRRAREKAKKP